MAWKRHPLAVLLALLAIHVLAHVDRNMLLGFSPQLTADLHLSNAQYGFLAGAVWVFSFGIMAVTLGTLSDRCSRTRVMAAGIFVWSLCTAASGMAGSFEQMAAARFLVASGEAALVPAAVSLLTEVVPPQRLGSAMGVFFMGIPLGVGLSFLLAGSIGASLGWRGTFGLLGIAGLAVAVPLLFLQDRREHPGAAGSHASAGRQIAAVLGVVRADPRLWFVIAGFVLVHMAFAGLAFAQLWLVRERGMDAAAIARPMGAVQLLFGVLGAAGGGALADRCAQRFRGGLPMFMAALVLACTPLMIAYRFAAPGSALFYAGMAAGAFLPLALYGPAQAAIQGLTPASMRSTVTGFTMMLINVFAIALGNFAVGAVSDALARAGAARPLTFTLLATDLLCLGAAGLFLLAARGSRPVVPLLRPLKPL